MASVGFVSPPICVEHLTGPMHPESPSRFDAINRRIREINLDQDLHFMEASQADLKHLKGVHHPSHVDQLCGLLQSNVPSIDGDTIVSAKTYEASLIAAGAAIQGVEEIVNGEHKKVFCNVRPPGHHAESERAMGFCFFNNVAVAAQYARAHLGIDKVLIIDWDVHHGNGTQDIFYFNPFIYYYSIHQWPLFPGTGAKSETGAGQGKGTNLNRPLMAGASDEDYLRYVEEDLNHICKSFEPELVIISAGFDAHAEDPLGGMRISTKGFAQLTRLVGSLANQYAKGRILSVLEGGYNLNALGDSVAQHIITLGDL